MESKRVVVSGMGIISSLDTRIDEFWNNCLDNRSSVEHIPGNWGGYHRFSSARECLSLDLDVTGFHLVNAQSFEEVPMTAFEKLVRLSIEFQAPYMWTETRFSTTALRNVLSEAELPPVCIDMAMLHRLNRWFFGRLDVPPPVAVGEQG